MINYYVFQLPADSKENIINVFDLHKIEENSRTTIFQNDEMRFSIDKKHVRVRFFGNDNQYLLEKLRNYFYGDTYEKST